MHNFNMLARKNIQNNLIFIQIQLFSFEFILNNNSNNSDYEFFIFH